MAEPIRVIVELGPKGKKCAAFAIDWPGWNRGAKTEEAAVALHASYRARYRPIAELAGIAAEFDTAGAPEVMHRYVGTGSTDFWGISFAPSDLDLEPITAEAFERKLSLLNACWTFFDEVAASVTPELKKGPRGGGRDRDQIITHVVLNERDWAAQVGVDTSAEDIVTDDGRRDHRARYLVALREHWQAGTHGRSRNLLYLLRHTAYHTLDHAWEMQDKTLG